MEKRFRCIEVKKIPTSRFVMSPIELCDVIDFDVKRMYFISGATAPTGAHCHLVEEELFVLVSGTCTAVIDRGQGLEELPMTAPTSAMYFPAYVWHHFKDFSKDAVLVALSSTNYSSDRHDYIEDYEEYLRIRHEKITV